MPHLIDQLTHPVIMAHRGASAHAPENTLAAFKLAVEQGADGVELDAKLTTDGRVVVIHDQTVNRTTGQNGIVREMTLAQLKRLDAGSFFDSAYAREQIPTLEEVFVAVGSRVLVNVEITNYTSVTDALPDRIADLVIKYGLQERVMFSSFHPLNLFRIRKRLPKAPAALLTFRGIDGWLGRSWLGRRLSPGFYHPYFTEVTPARLEGEHRAGRRVNTWTVNEAGDMRRLFKMGIDGIITDDPLLARRVMEEK